MRQLSLKLTIVLVTLFSFLSPVAIQAGNTGGGPIQPGANLGLCTFIGPICTALGLSDKSADEAKEGALGFATERIQQVVSLIFIGIIVISVFIIVQAGVKYIQSQGEEGKIAEAQKAIRSVFVGIAILFVGIIGLILVLAFFGGTGLLGSGNTIDDVFNPPGSN
jgi:uncharacterized membrane protein YidH (DUF202 family)